TDPFEAAEFISHNKVDLLFLDMHMPDISGVDWLKANPMSCPVIFTTAYPQYALAGFDLNAVDFLLKPVKYERFAAAIHKAEKTINLSRIENKSDFFFVKSEYQLVKIFAGDILFIESLDDYLKIHHGLKRPTLTLMTMKKMLDQLPQEQFIRVHRSYTVQLSKIESVKNRKIKIGEHQIPIGDIYAESFLSRMKDQEKSA
ncbi:MAG: DNA-binding response regulator, partial [Bacteroidota bacterium]|nr:DNA-binding response regulator [Bacteroidota bacterium]